MIGFNLIEPRSSLAVLNPMRRAARSKIIQHEQANCGKTDCLADGLLSDLADQFGTASCPEGPEISFMPFQKGLFEADAGLVTPDHDRAFHDRRLHDASSAVDPVLIQQILSRAWVRCSSRTRSDFGSAETAPGWPRLFLADCSRPVRLLELLQVDPHPPCLSPLCNK